MRYGLRVEMPGVTQAQYDALHAQIESLVGDDTPSYLVHIAGPIEGGWCVTEVWASKADFEQFMVKMAPMMSSPDAPKMNIQEFTVHNCETRAQLPA
jgi:hypothetical protein